MSEDQEKDIKPDVPATDVSGDETPPKADTVPSGRLREEADKRRAAESKLKTLEDANAKRERDELEAQGKHEEVISSQSQEIEKLKADNLSNAFDRAIEKGLNKVIKVSDPVERQERVEILSKSVDRNKLQFTDGQVSGLSEQIKEMEGRSTFKMLFGIDSDDTDETADTVDPSATTADRSPNNSTKTIKGAKNKADVQRLARGMNNEDLNKAAAQFGIEPFK